MSDPQSDPSASPRILHIDDDERLIKSVARMLRMHGYSQVEGVSDPSQAVDRIRAGMPDVVLLDLVMPGCSGIEILGTISRECPKVGVIILTAEYDPKAAVECMRLGAKDFLQKPSPPEDVLASIARVLENAALSYEADSLRSQFFSTQLRNPDAFSEIVTQDEQMLRVFAYLESVARGSQPLLIRGETGTGKELAARALHFASNRTGEFVAVNVAGLDDELFSDTLFGHVRGAFTGADRDRVGMIERASGGTLLLDEIGDLAEVSQIKLLRVLQEKEFHPVGSDKAKPLDARIVAATHHPAERLREDLYFRLRAYQVEIPPLRERLGDLPLLVDIFLEAAALDLEKEKPVVPDELFIDLSNENFPGNIRELRAIVFDAVARHTDGIMPISLFTENRSAGSAEAAVVRETPTTAFPHPMPLLREIEQSAVIEALRRVKGNRSAAARMLGISRPKVLRHVAESDDSEN